MVITYYVGKGARITDSLMEIWIPEYQRFVILELRDVHVTHGRATNSWLNRPIYELRATYRGRPVQLYASRDAQTFGQVKRALLRALERAWAA
jgi:hypothetical protein